MSRRRDIKKSFWIDYKEEQKLKELCFVTGKSESEIFRNAIEGKQVKQKPDDEFYETIKDLRQLSNSLSRAILLLREDNEVDVITLKSKIIKIDGLIVELKRQYLL